MAGMGWRPLPTVRPTVTRRTTHDRFYVTARTSDSGRHGSVAWLLGPFETHAAAVKMVEAVRHACNAHMNDPRFAFAAFGTSKLTKPIDRPFKPGTLPFWRCVDDVWISYVCNDGFRRKQ